jgi:hypothetical protein
MMPRTRRRILGVLSSRWLDFRGEGRLRCIVMGSMRPPGAWLRLLELVFADITESPRAAACASGRPLLPLASRPECRPSIGGGLSHTVAGLTGSRASSPTPAARSGRPHMRFVYPSAHEAVSSDLHRDSNPGCATPSGFLNLSTSRSARPPFQPCFMLVALMGFGLRRFPLRSCCTASRRPFPLPVVAAPRVQARCGTLVNQSGSGL